MLSINLVFGLIDFYSKTEQYERFFCIMVCILNDKSLKFKQNKFCYEKFYKEKAQMEFSTIILIGSGVIGFVVGALTGVFGVGGGFLMTPALMIILGIPAPIAVGTGLATILPNSSFAMFRRRGSKTVDVKLALTISAGSVVGVLFGSQIMEVLKDAPKILILGREQDALQYSLLCTFLVLLACIAGYLFYDYKRNGGKSPQKRIGMLARLKLVPYMHFASLEEPRLSVLALLVLGFLIGTLTGLMGVGGGVVMLPSLIYLVGQRTGKAAGTSLLLVWISSLVAVVRKGAAGQISLCLFLALLAGGIAGTFIGTKIGLKLSGPRIRLYFVYVVIAAIGLIGYKLYMLTF